MPMRHHVGVSTPVPSPRPGGDDGDGPQLPQQRAVDTPRPGSAPADQAGPGAPADESGPGASADEAGPGAVVGDPRPAPDDAPVPRAVVERDPEPASTARVYADGSALAQYVGDAAWHEDWLAWATGNEAGLVTTPLGLTELRRIALPGGV